MSLKFSRLIGSNKRLVLLFFICILFVELFSTSSANIPNTSILPTNVDTLNGLVSAYHFDELYNGSQSNGILTHDSSGNNYTATLAGSSGITSWGTGIYGNAPTIITTNTTVTAHFVANDSVASLYPNQITVFAWIKPDALQLGSGVDYGYYARRDGGSGANRTYYFTQRDGNAFRVSLWNSSGGRVDVQSNNGTTVQGQWQTVAFTYDGSATNLYWNGSLVKSSSFSGALPTYSVPATDFGSAYNGTIDEIMTFNKALSAQQIWELTQYYGDTNASNGTISIKTVPSNVIDSNTFSIIQISDTQFLSRNYSYLYDNLTTWIAENKQNYNIQAVVHTGDIIQDYNNATQWANANNSMAIILNNNIPYCWAAGNHDTLTPSSGWLGDNYQAFNASYLSSKSYWVDSYNEGKNTAIQFTFGSYKFLVVTVEYDANATALAWMQNLITVYSDSNIIVATHAYLNSTGGYYDHYGNTSQDVFWGADFYNLLNQYQNVKLVLCGHDDGVVSALHAVVNGRLEFMFDRQEQDSRYGADTARIYTFNLTSQSVQVQTFKIYTNPQFMTATEFSMNLSDSLQKFAVITATTETGGNLSPLGTITVGYGSNQTFTYSANSNYILSRLLVDGTPINLTTNPTNFTLSNIQTNHTVSLKLSNPTPTPAPEPTSTGNQGGTSNSRIPADSSFDIDAVSLGQIAPDKSVTATLHFTFKSQHLTLRSLSFSEPFQSWHVNNINLAAYSYSKNSDVGSGDILLTFKTPSTLSCEQYLGTITVAATDEVGDLTSSSNNISAFTYEYQAESDWMNQIRSNPLYILLIIAVVAASLFLLVSLSKRR